MANFGHFIVLGKDGKKPPTEFDCLEKVLRSIKNSYEDVTGHDEVDIIKYFLTKETRDELKKRGV